MITKLFGLGKPSRLIKTANLLLEGIQTQANVPAIQSVIEWLENNQAHMFQEGKTLEVVRLLDEPLQKLVEAAKTDMLDSASNPTRLNILVNAAGRVSELMVSAFQQALEKELSTHKKVAKGVALFVHFGYLYWLAQRYAIAYVKKPIETRFSWPEVYAHYERAIEIDPSIKENLQSRMAYLLLIVRSLGASMNGRQMLIAERLIGVMAGFLDTQANPKTVIGAKVSDGKDPTLLTTIPTQQGKVIFFGLDKCLLELVSLEQQVANGGKLPSKYDIDGKLAPAETLAVIKYLRSRWSGKEIKRNSTRLSAEGMMTVFHGFPAAVWRLQHQNQPDAFCPVAIESAVASCIIEDTSATGYGLLLKQSADWPRVGQLMLLRQSEHGHCALAILRRVILKDAGSMLLGTQLLSLQPEYIALEKPPVQGSAQAIAFNETPAGLPKVIFLPPEPLTQNAPGVIAAEGVLRTGQLWHFNSTVTGKTALKVGPQLELGMGFQYFQCVLAKAH